MALSSLAKRVLTATVLVPLVLAALFLLPPRGWALVTLAVVALAAHEWTKLAGYSRQAAILFIAGTLALGFYLLWLPAAGFAHGWPKGIVVASCAPAVVFWALVAPVWLARGWPTQLPIAMAVVGWIVLAGVWVALVQLQAHSPWLALAAMAIVGVADTAAYFTGRALGRRKLAPKVSPGKTWEGVYGALVAVALYALALVPLASRAGYAGAQDALAIALWLLFAMALAAISVVGDLFESLLKRHAGLKDSGTLLPGHGGILDRIDALLAAMPPAAIGATWLLG